MGRRQGSARQAGAQLLSRRAGEARMSSRYISHRYGEREEVRSSRATSRASSRAPSLAGSRASSVLDLSSIQPTSRATSQAPRGLPSGPRPKRWSAAMEYSNQRMEYTNQRQEFSTSSGLPPMPESRPRARPLSSSYSDALIKSSQRLRERSATPPPPQPILDIKPTPFKTNIDYYRGKTKSIYEKQPIFRDFARNIPLSQSLDDSSSLHSLKRDFQKLVS